MVQKSGVDVGVGEGYPTPEQTMGQWVMGMINHGHGSLVMGQIGQ